MGNLSMSILETDSMCLGREETELEMLPQVLD
jgi:hypothetical protein